MIGDLQDLAPAAILMTFQKTAEKMVADMAPICVTELTKYEQGKDAQTNFYVKRYNSNYKGRVQK